MKIVIINYIPISYYSERFFGGRAHLKALINGFSGNRFHIVQFGGISRPYFKYDKLLHTLFINIFPYNKNRNEKSTIKFSKQRVSLVVRIIKTVLSVLISSLISLLGIFITTYYYERANKSFSFRPLFSKKKLLEINDAFVPEDYSWYDIIVCVDKPIHLSQKEISYFLNPWPNDIDTNELISKDFTSKAILNLIIINSSPHGIKLKNIIEFIKYLKKGGYNVKIFFLGNRDDETTSFLTKCEFEVAFFPLLLYEKYKELIKLMDIAFVTYGDSLDSNQLRIAVPMKIMDLLATGVKVYCDQRFNIFENEKYNGIVTYFDSSMSIFSIDLNIHTKLKHFLLDTNPVSYVKKMIQL